MNTTENTKILEVYGGKKEITESGYTMVSNYALPLLSRMVREHLITSLGRDLVLTILSYKHGEKNPYPSNELLSNVLGVSTTKISKGLSSLKKAGALLIEKSGRKNTYNLNPFFEMLEKFIVEFKKGNPLKEVAEFLAMDKPESKNAVPEIKEKSTGSDSVQEAKQENSKPEEEPASEEVAEGAEQLAAVKIPELPESILRSLSVCNVSDKGAEAVKLKYAVYSEFVSDKLFIQKITAASKKENFIAFFDKCIDNAFINGETVDESPAPKQNQKPAATKRTGGTTRTELLPEWFENPEQAAEKELNKSELDEEFEDMKRELEAQLAERTYKSKQVI